MLVREGAVLPHAKLAQSTMQMDWSAIELVVYGSSVTKSKALVCLPADNVLRHVEVEKKNNAFVMSNDFSKGSIKWKIRNSTE